ALMLCVKLKTDVPAAAIAVALVQVMFWPAALQVQLAACAPPNVTAPAVIVIPAGNTSTTVMVPALATLPVLLTVSVYVVVPPATTVPVPFVLASVRFGELTVSGPSIAQPSVGVSVAVQAPAVAAVGAVGFVGSPPPPTWARFVSVPVVPALMLGVKVNTLVPAAAIAVALVQVMFWPAALQVQFAACAPPNVTAPAVIVIPAGRTLTMVIVPALATLPVLLTV